MCLDNILISCVYNFGFRNCRGEFAWSWYFWMYLHKPTYLCVSLILFKHLDDGCFTAQVIREGINKNKGYEIYTEGDAFAISFLDVPTAVIFAMDIQYRLTDTHWPKEILKLPSCGIEYDKDGDIVRKGPRVRMGIHFATEGSVVMRYSSGPLPFAFGQDEFCCGLGL